MKMVSGGTNKMTMTVNTSGAAPKVDTVINNTVTAGIPQGGQLASMVALRLLELYSLHRLN